MKKGRHSSPSSGSEPHTITMLPDLKDPLRRSTDARLVAAILSTLMMACGGQHSASAPSSAISPAPAQPTSGPTEPPAIDLTGQYTLTLLASPSCAVLVDNISHQPLPFPSAAQTRSYDAKITQRFGQLEVVFTPAECAGGYYERPGICAPIPARVDCHTRVFSAGGCALGSVSGHDLIFDVTPAPATPECAGGDYWWEPFTATEVFEACGAWRASIDDPAHIVGAVDGTFAYHRASPEPRPNQFWESALYCHASDHHFALTEW